MDNPGGIPEGTPPAGIKIEIHGSGRVVWEGPSSTTSIQLLAAMAAGLVHLCDSLTEVLRSQGKTTGEEVLLWSFMELAAKAQCDKRAERARKAYLPPRVAPRGSGGPTNPSA